MNFCKNPRPLPARPLNGILLGICLLLGTNEAARGPFAARSHSPFAKEELILEGVVTEADAGKYIERDFHVPQGIERIDVAYDYTHRGQGTVLDIGIFDPRQFRGWSGSHKTQFFIARRGATPSYIPGEIPPGRWRILLGVGHIRPGTTSRYTVKIVMTRETTEGQPAASGVASRIRRRAPGWYAGDLHSHTGHSDGFCRNPKGELVACPVFKVVEAAAERGLDFLAITDHNTTSHHAEMDALQDYYPDLLLIRGQELTTFRGHANLYGTSAFVDFRLGVNGRTVNDVLREARRTGGLVSINHPALPSGEQCRGCGWQDVATTDFRLVDMIEVVNGNRVEGSLSGIPFWEQRLNEGFRLTGIGGGDDHRAGSGEQPDNVMGAPTTVVYATELSEPAVMAGLKAGHVYIRTRGPQGPHVELTAEDEHHRRFLMGDEIIASRAGEHITLTISIKDGMGQKVEVVKNGRVFSAVEPMAVTSPDFRATIRVPAEDRAWYRLTLRDDRGITVITNPIYLRVAPTSKGPVTVVTDDSPRVER